MLRSGEMGSLSAGPGSPTDTADKTAKQGEPAPGASGASSPDPNRFDGGGAPVNRREAAARARPWEESMCRPQPRRKRQRAPRRAERCSDLSICQVQPEKTSWPVPSLEPDKIPPELQPNIPEASGAFHSLWIQS